MQQVLINSLIHPRIYQAWYHDSSVFLTDPQDVGDLYHRGIFGKGLISQRQPHVGVDDLHLSLPEAFYLSYAIETLEIRPLKDILKNTNKKQKLNNNENENNDNDIKQQYKPLPMKIIDLWLLFQDLNPRFVPLYATYHLLRSRGWVPRCGIKYGADFVVYRGSPQWCHAEYCIIVKFIKDGSYDCLDAHSNRDNRQVALQGLLRMTHTIAKDLLMCLVICPDGVRFSDPSCIQKLKIRFQLIRRWEPARQRCP